MRLPTLMSLALAVALAVALAGAAVPALAAPERNPAEQRAAPERTPPASGAATAPASGAPPAARSGERRRRMSYAACNRESHRRNLYGGPRRRFLIRCRLGYERRPGPTAPARRP